MFLTVIWRGFTLEYVVNKINIQFSKEREQTCLKTWGAGYPSFENGVEGISVSFGKCTLLLPKRMVQQGLRTWEERYIGQSLDSFVFKLCFYITVQENDGTLFSRHRMRSFSQYDTLLCRRMSVWHRCPCICLTHGRAESERGQLARELATGQLRSGAWVDARPFQ